MTLIWFKPTRPSGETLAVMLERLRPLGVRWRRWSSTPPNAMYQYRDGELIKQIGWVNVHVDTGTINIWPMAGTSAMEKIVLAGCAQRAFERQPRKSDGWTRRRTKSVNRWDSVILVRADPDTDLVAAAVARHYASIDNDAWDRVGLGETQIDVVDVDSEHLGLGR